MDKPKPPLTFASAVKQVQDILWPADSKAGRKVDQWERSAVAAMRLLRHLDETNLFHHFPKIELTVDAAALDDFLSGVQPLSETPAQTAIPAFEWVTWNAWKVFLTAEDMLAIELASCGTIDVDGTRTPRRPSELSGADFDDAVQELFKKHLSYGLTLYLPDGTRVPDGMLAGDATLLLQHLTQFRVLTYYVDQAAQKHPGGAPKVLSAEQITATQQHLTHLIFMRAPECFRREELHKKIEEFLDGRHGNRAPGSTWIREFIKDRVSPGYFQ